MSQVLINDIIRQLKELQEGSLWFDQYFKEKIGAVPAEQAFIRPIPELHSVAEHVSHMIEWRNECLLRFNGKQQLHINSPGDWRNNAELESTGWEKLKALLYESTDALIRVLEYQDDAFLENRFLDTGYNFHYLIEGILQHDLYHLGQIGITIRLLKERPGG